MSNRIAPTAAAALHEALNVTLRIVERDRLSVVGSCSLLRTNEAGEVEVVPGTLDISLAERVAEYDAAIQLARTALALSEQVRP